RRVREARTWRGQGGADMFRNMRIDSRLALGFALVQLLAIAGITLGVSRLSELNRTSERIVNQEWTKVKLARDVMSAANANAQLNLALFIQSSDAERARTLAQIDDNRHQITEHLDQL